METPFDLNQAIQQWRESLGQSPVFSNENLDELESHLRDSVDTLVAKGLAKEEAFRIAVQRCGSRKLLETEFAKPGTIGVFRGILAAISALLALMFGAASYWLFYLTDGRYAITRLDGSILYNIYTSRGWGIFSADVLITLVLLWATYALLRRSKRRAVR